MNMYSVVFDLAALAILTLCAAYYARKGFISGLFSFFGTLIAFVLAWIAATNLAPAIFNSFIRPSVEEHVAQAIGQNGATSVRQILEQSIGFLPDNIIEIIHQALDVQLDFSASDIVVNVVNSVMVPIVVPLISIILFFILFSLFRVLMGVIRTLAVGIAKMPAMNTLNSALGALVGVLIGALYVFIALSAIWAYDSLNPQSSLGGAYFSDSITWGLLQGFNFFS